MYVRDKTPDLFKDFFSLGEKLDFSNRWLALAEMIPWEKIDDMYSKNFSANSGRRAMDSRLVCGLFLVKHIKDLSDEETIKEYEENPYIQAFCGRLHFSKESDFSLSLLSDRRKRLGKEFWDFWTYQILPILDEQKVFKYYRNKKEKSRLICGFLGKIKERFFSFFSI